jgi:hypothetical protein
MATEFCWEALGRSIQYILWKNPIHWVRVGEIIYQLQRFIECKISFGRLITYTAWGSVDSP